MDGDLIRILAASGQGQGGLSKWVDAVGDDGDKLMLIEAIPSAHQRGSVRDALIWSWRYAAALNLPATSLDALAAGRYPRLVRAGGARRARAMAAFPGGRARAASRDRRDDHAEFDAGRASHHASKEFWPRATRMHADVACRRSDYW